MEDIQKDDLSLSKTKKKKQAKEIDVLAENLVALGDRQFAQLELSDLVLSEVELARSTKGRGSYKRQLKHLSAILRKLDDELEQIKTQLTDLDQVNRTDKKQFHTVEKLRDRLCQQDSFEVAFTEMLELAPSIDRNVISRLARSVHQHEDKRAYREIFKRLRDALDGN
jgi:ribosome-associated protein